MMKITTFKVFKPAILNRRGVIESESVASRKFLGRFLPGLNQKEEEELVQMSSKRPVGGPPLGLDS